jgi:hypothetical protein
VRFCKSADRHPAEYSLTEPASAAPPQKAKTRRRRF